MRITADTNVLVRAIVGDEEGQAAVAQAVLAEAETVAITVPALCELVWVLTSRYKIADKKIAEVVRGLIDTSNVVTNRRAAEAGLELLYAGGDFADGVIAHEGRLSGADTFVSFDQKAVKLIDAHGTPSKLLR